MPTWVRCTHIYLLGQNQHPHEDEANEHSQIYVSQVASGRECSLDGHEDADASCPEGEERQINLQ